MKNFKDFISEEKPNIKRKAKGEQDFVDAHEVEVTDLENSGTEGPAKVTTKAGSGKRKADKDNKQEFGEEVEVIDESTGQQISAKMMKSKTMKPFAAKVSKMAKVTRADLEKMLPDYVSGAEITKLFKEEVEEIDEVSKELLARYAKSATVDARMSQRTAKDFERHELKSRKPEYKAGAKEWKDKYQERAWKRQAGVHKAIDRLAKEEVEELDELKTSTLWSYRKKASDDFQKRLKEPLDLKKDIPQKNALSNRIGGMRNADIRTMIRQFGRPEWSKGGLAFAKGYKKEEVELDEEQLIEMDAKDLPFTPDKPKKNPPAKAGKYGQGHSTAKHLAQQGLKKTLRQKKKSMQEADFSKKETKMAHTIGKEFEKKGVGDESKGGPYAVASAMVRDKPEAAKKAYKTIQSKMKEEADAELLFNLYNDLNEENQEMFMSQLEEDADSLLEFARMMEEE